MKKLILAVTVLVIGAAGYVVYAQRQPEERPVPKLPPKIQRRAMVTRIQEYVPPFPVIVDPDLDPETKALYEQLAKQLSGVGVPDDRLNFYSALIGAPGYRIKGWAGVIDAAAPIPGGYLVTVRVSPSVDSDRFGPATVVSSEYAEQYRVINGTVQYVGFLDPEGMFGKFPDDMRGY
jgi:hypothetical protein